MRSCSSGLWLALGVDRMPARLPAAVSLPQWSVAESFAAPEARDPGLLRDTFHQRAAP